MELDKLHVRDNVKLAEVNIKMFLYQDNIPMFEIWLCLSSDVKAKKMSLFFHKWATKQRTAKERKSETVKIDVLRLCYRFFLLCAQPYTTVGLCDIFVRLKFFCLELLFKDSSKPKKHQYLVQLDVVLTHWRTKMGLKSKEVRFKSRFLMELS